METLEIKGTIKEDTKKELDQIFSEMKASLFSSRIKTSGSMGRDLISYLKYLRTLARSLDEHPEMLKEFGDNSSDILQEIIDEISDEEGGIPYPEHPRSVGVRKAEVSASPSEF